MVKTSNAFMENILIRLIAYGPIVFVPFVTFMMSYMIINSNEIKFQHEKKDIEKSYLQAQKSTTLSRVEIAIKMINYKRSMTEKMLKEKVKTRVDAAYSIAEHLYEQNKKIHSKKEVQKMIIDSLRPLTWNNGESFIFILDFQGVFFLAPEYLRHLEGKSIIDFQDATKRYVIKEEINLAKTKGSGYLWDTFTRKGYDRNLQFKQLAYIKKFDDYNWYMGSTEYLDTSMKLIRLSVLDILQNAFADQSDYFFVIDKKGNLIMEGQNINMKKGNILNITDIDGKEFVKELIKSAQTNSNEFVSYKWRNPSTDKIELKYSYVKSVPHSDWIIGSGFYINGVNEQIKLKQHELQVSYQKDYKNLLFFSFLLIGASLVVSYIISIMLKKRFLDYSNDINAKRDELQALNKSLENQVKKRTQELKKAYKEMKKIAITDSLTNIYNRYFFNDALKNEFSRAKRYNSTFALIMFDIDHFKNINDTYGHIKGDEVLKSMTEIIKEHLRVSDIFARTGGEEFMIILPNTNITLATEIAQRIRACVEKYNFNLQSNITISIGVVTHKDNDTHQSILKRVDNALYAAKESGRNSVIVDI